MKVALLINSLAGGGAEKQLLLCSAGLARAGFACEVFWLEDRPVHPRNNELVEIAKKSGIEFRVPRTGSKVDIRQLFKIRRFLGGEPDAVLWTWGYRADLVSIGLLFMSKQTKIIGSLRDAFQHRTWQVSWLSKIISRTHRAFISNSILNIKQASIVAPRLFEKSAVVYNGIEEKYFERRRIIGDCPTSLRIVMLGNQRIYKKGYDLAVQVAERIKLKKLPIKIYIAGAPLDGLALDDLVRKHSVAGVIELVGGVADPLGFLAEGDLFMMLSRFEGTPNALLEAMALGLPAICTQVGDMSTLAENGIHLRLIATDAESAFQAIVDLWQDWPKTQVMAAMGRDFCREHFRERGMIDFTVGILREVGAGRSIFGASS
jgi:glycosyltransferase involved in cell wall biosynthesis